MKGQVWSCTLVIPVFRKQRQEDYNEFETSLVFLVGCRLVKDYIVRSCLKNKTKPKPTQTKPYLPSLATAICQKNLYKHNLTPGKFFIIFIN